MKLDLSQALTTGRCTNVNVRPENHGEEKVTALDFSINFDAPNTILDAFHPKLREALFFDEAGTNGQSSVDGVPEVLPNFMFVHLELPLKWDAQLSGYKLEIDYGLGDEDSNIEIPGCKVGKFKLTPKEGGSVNVGLQVQASTESLSAEQKGQLMDLPTKPTMQFRLTPPDVEEEEQREEEPVDTRQTPAQALAAQLGIPA
jgi:hypothetical protein